MPDVLLFGPFDFAQGNACFNRWLKCDRFVPKDVLLRPAVAGLRRIKRRALIFDILVLMSVHDWKFVHVLFVGASAFARGFGVTGRRDENPKRISR